MSSISNFLTNENISMLWELIYDGNIIKNNSKDFDNHILKVFKENLSPFFETERKNTNNLVDMNKKYIMLMINFIQSSISVKNKPIELPKENKELITIEEIQNSRQDTFERDLNRRQEEFSNSMSIAVPPVPNFSIKLDDEPIVEIEKTIKKMVEQRNYDINIINKSHELPENWLQSKETSIKNEKNSKKTVKNGGVNPDTEPKLKYIKIDKNSNIDNSLYKSQMIDLNRHITWKDEQNINDATPEINIFDKFKKIENFNEDKISLMQNDIQMLKNKILNIDKNINTIIERLSKKND